MSYKTIIISDLHLGSKSSRADDIIKFLEQNTCYNLFLNGDIIDGWALKRGSKWKDKHTKVVRKILKIAEKGTNVVWIRGNHDDFLETYLGLSMGNIHIRDEITYKGIDKRLYYISHGDKLDVFSTKFKFIAKIGSIGYDFALWLNQWYNFFREWMGLPYYSLSKRIKDNVKLAVNFVTDFEENAIKIAKQKNCDVAVCGHIHKAEIKNAAFRNRDTNEPWPEGSWCEAGDYIRVPKWGGDRWEVPVPGDDSLDDPALFMILNDHEVIAKVTCNPLIMRAFI